MEHRGSAVVLETGALVNRLRGCHANEPRPSVTLRNDNNTTAVGSITRANKPDKRWMLEVIFGGSMCVILSGADDQSEPLRSCCIVAFAIWIQVAVKHAATAASLVDHISAEYGYGRVAACAQEDYGISL